MSEEKGPSVGVLRWRGFEVPKNIALQRAIGLRDKKQIPELEKSYIMTLCATKNGCNMQMIVNAICAHWQADIHPARIAAHMIELTERGIIVRHYGNYRISEEAMEHMRQMLKDDAKGSHIRTTVK